MSLILDIGHIAFLEMIRAMVQTKGAAAAKGELIRMAMTIAKDVKAAKYASLEEYATANADHSSPLTQLEGESQLSDNGMVTLAVCPFAPSIRSYTNVVGSLPAVYDEIVAEFNKPGNHTSITNKLRIAEGSGVSPFCCLHQALRSVVAEKIEVAGKPIKVSMLGCKSGSGKKALAGKWLDTVKGQGITREDVDKALDKAMCCYAIGKD